MNKFLYTGIAIMLTYHIEACAKPDYIKVAFGLNTIKPLTFDTKSDSGKISPSHSFPAVELAVGKRLTDNLSTEIAFYHYSLSHAKESSNDKKHQYKLEHKNQASSMMINLSNDVFIKQYFDIYITGGIGASRLKDKASGYMIIKSNKQKPLDSTSTKTVIRFAYKLGVGTRIKLCDGIDLDLGYNYFALGKNRPKIINGITNLKQREYYIHNITTGIYFKL